jgi:23S rRNA pseudouridine1911/1915/1917 synthase
VSSARLLPVPDGLDGLRLDVAISRMLGYSRTAAADLIDAGHISIDGVHAARSAKVHAGSWLEITEPEVVPAAPPTPVDGLVVLYDDDDLLVVDKPVGVAAHPSPGWTGPTVTQGLAAMGYRLAEGGPAERQGIVHRLDVGTTGVMAVAKSERAYSALKLAFKERTVDKRYSALVQGHPDPTRGTIDAPIARHPGSAYKFAVVSGGRASVPGGHPARRPPGDWAHAPDPRAHGGRPPSVRGRPHLWRRPHPVGPARTGSAVAARPRTRVRAPGHGRAAPGRLALSGRPRARAGRAS